ncbi:transient receptor potential cation channel subfamily A member 1-like [Malaya genurostris]|uniref:transient receptor potential cation channel subfamily A member 1-like n=1 Tax=Malaya genurostris TaxID=325434 RepID=UPI0026F3A997|nr:transient receptor potential cation channel subfamily A member 1-like [Malaya genurostris]
MYDKKSIIQMMHKNLRWHGVPAALKIPSNWSLVYNNRFYPELVLQAAQNGDLEEFKRLIDGDPRRLMVKDTSGRTPAHLAAAKDDVAILSFIYDHGGDLNEQDSSLNSPLHEAIENDSLDAIEFLLKM